MQLVNLTRLRESLPDKTAAYATAQPFPHTVLDDVLTEAAFGQAVAEFPGTDDAFWRGYLHVNETKYSNTRPDTWGPTLAAIAEELCSEEFVTFLEELTGISDLHSDWSMDGGGLHQTLRGGHLNIHADFSTHHTRETWARRVNILLYLNDEWREEWGGQLELWDRGMSRREGVVTPKGNRMLVFSTGAHTYHGHPDPLTCPDGMARRSLALYYFTEESAPARISTDYRARPGDGAKKYAIWADKTALDLYDRVKRRLGVDDRVVQRVMAAIRRRR